jgi:hypothetical protein
MVRTQFEKFDWIIVAEFFCPDSAYDFEQELILENWNNPLLLNKFYRLGPDSRFRSFGPQSPEHLEKRISKRRGWKARPDQKQNYCNGQARRWLEHPDSDATRKKKSDMHKGVYHIVSPSGQEYTTDLGLKDFAAIHGQQLGISFWALFNAYRKNYQDSTTTANRKNINKWRVTRLDKP